jgi:hypothetical protein
MTKVCINCYMENPPDAVLCAECGMSLRRAATGEEAIKLREGYDAQSRRKEEAGVQLEEPPPAETPTDQTRLAYRLAAILLLVGVSMNIIEALLVGGTVVAAYIPPIGIDLVLGIGLLRLSGRARFWVLVRAVLGAIIWPILLFLGTEPFSAMVMSTMQWAYSIALFLLLTGQGKTWRMGLALAVFAGFTLGPFGLGLLTMALVWLVRM